MVEEGEVKAVVQVEGVSPISSWSVGRAASTSKHVHASQTFRRPSLSWNNHTDFYHSTTPFHEPFTYPFPTSGMFGDWNGC